MVRSETKDTRFRRLAEPVTSSAAPWLRLHELLGELRRENIAKGGDDAELARVLSLWLAQFSAMPVRVGAGE